MAEQPAEEKQPSARAKLRAYIRGEIRGKTEVSLVEVAKRAVRWATKDRTYLKALLLDLLQPIVYAEAQNVIARSRESQHADDSTHNLVQLGDEVVSRGVLRDRSKRLSKNWLTFREHAGSRHVLLLDMSTEDLEAAEAERRQRGDVEHGYADLWAKLRARMEQGQTVRNVWSAEEIEAAYQSVKRSNAA